MSLFSRIFGKGDDRAAVRPLWHRLVAIAREKQWYAIGGIADTVPGRFDAITLVLALALLRMEREEELAQKTGLLTELFVEDMDGQLRESGVGDLGVGKQMGKLMSVLGGRLGALRDAIPQGEAAMAQVIARNVSLIDGAAPAAIAAEALNLVRQMDALTATDLLAGNIER